MGARYGAVGEELFPIPNDALVIEFDLAANPELASDITNNWNALSLIEGMLCKNGVPVTIQLNNEQKLEGREITDSQARLATAEQASVLLNSIASRQRDVDTRLNAIASDSASVAGAGTIAALRQFVVAMMASEKDKLEAEKRQLEMLETIIHALRS